MTQSDSELLFTAAETPAAPGLEHRGRPVRPYDFRRPSRISRERQRALEAIYGVFAKSLEGWLAGRVRHTVEVRLGTVEQFDFGEFVASLPTPCASFVVDVGGGRQGVVEFGSEFAFLMVDRLLGGSGPVAVLDRALTALERQVVRLAADRVAAQLADAWSDHVQIEMSVSRFEVLPEMIQVGNREDPFLVSSIEISAANTQGTLLCCLPFPVLEKFFAGGAPTRLTAGSLTGPDRDVDRQGIESSLRATRLPVSVRLTARALPLSAVAELKEGHVFETGVPAAADLEVSVSGVNRFRARPGRVGRKLAARIVATVDASEEAPGTPTERGKAK